MYAYIQMQATYFGSLSNFLEHQNKFLNKDTDVKLGVLNLDFVSHWIVNITL